MYFFNVALNAQDGGVLCGHKKINEDSTYKCKAEFQPITILVDLNQPHIQTYTSTQPKL
jgi:hypothetical protein